MTQTFSFLLILIIFNTSESSSVAKKKECSLLSNKYFEYSTINTDKLTPKTVLIKGFDSFDELNFDCGSVNLTVETVFFIPNKDILLDNTMSIKHLLYSITFSYKDTVVFTRIKGFNTKLPYQRPGTSYGHLNVLFLSSKFDFYLNGTKIDETNCKLSNFNEKYDAFGPINILTIDSLNYYSKKTCPYVFMNTRLNRLTLGQISNSLIIKNQFEFLDINQTNDFDLKNEDLFYLNIGLAYEDVTAKIINKYVFRNLQALNIWGVVNSIQGEVFFHLTKLRFIYLYIENIRQFLGNSDENWWNCINILVYIDLNNLNQVEKNLDRSVMLEIVQKNSNLNSRLSFTKAYTFPDEDFCLFRNFPHNKLVYPLIVSSVKIECTCTIIWLIQYSSLYFMPDYEYFRVNEYVIDYRSVYGDEYINHTSKACLNKDLKKKIQKCKFQDRLKNCEKFPIKLAPSFIFSDIGVFFLIKWVELVLFIFLIPAICLLGLITNLLSILTLKQNLKSKKEKEPAMYSHILFNSIFNFIYCGLNLVKLINVCISDISPFCSSIYQWHSSQYFKLVFIYYFGNAIKLCCNVSYTLFALSRFSLSANKKTGIYKKLEELNLKKCYSIAFMTCLAFSIFNIFEFHINEFYYQFKSFPFDKYDINNCDMRAYYCKFFRAFNIANDFIKDVVFFLTNFIIDLFLLNLSKKNLEHKIKTLNDDAKNVKTAKKSKNKIANMVAINSVIFFVSFFPDFFLKVLIISYNKHLYSFCEQFISCKEFGEFAEIFTFISISLQFFVFKNFNKTFNEKYQSLKAKFLKSFKRKKQII